MSWYKKLHWQIIVGLVLGLLWGLLSASAGWNEFTSGTIRPFGTIFINLLKLVAVPLVLVSLVVGVSSLNNMSRLTRMGGKTILIYLATTLLAITIGLSVVNLVDPGSSLPESTRNSLMENYSAPVSGNVSDQESGSGSSILDFLVRVVPQNFFASASENGNMLQIVFVAILLGLGIISIPAQKSQTLIEVFDSLNEVIIKIVDLIMKLAPIGVFALMASVIIDLAGDNIRDAITLLKALAWYSLTVIAGLVIHVLFVYSVLFKIFSKMKLSDFFRAIRPAILLGFSTSSSLATLPVTMERVEKHLGVSEEVSSFVLPVGATINMDGTSLYQAVAAVFIAQAIGMELTLAQQITIVFTATAASIGAAGVPGAGIIMLVIVLQAVQVPVEGIALILGVDRILDMARTAVNVTGDAAVSVAVAHTEGKLGALHFDE